MAQVIASGTKHPVKEGFDAFIEYSKSSIISSNDQSSINGWQDGASDASSSSNATPLDAKNLNRMHYALIAIRDALINTSTSTDGGFHMTVNGKDIVFDSTHPLFDTIKQVADCIVGNPSDNSIDSDTTITLKGLRNYLRSLDAQQQNTTLSFLSAIEQVDGKIVNIKTKSLGVSPYSDNCTLGIGESLVGGHSSVTITNANEVYARRNLGNSIIEFGSAYTEDTNNKSPNMVNKIIVERAANIKTFTDEAPTSTDTISLKIGDKQVEHTITRVNESIMSDDTLLQSVNGRYATRSVGGINGSQAIPLRMDYATVNDLLVDILGITDGVTPNGFSISTNPSCHVALGKEASNVLIPLTCQISKGTHEDATFTYYVGDTDTLWKEGATNRESGQCTITVPITADSVSLIVKCVWDGDPSLYFTATSNISILRDVYTSALAKAGTAPSSVIWSAGVPVHKSAMSNGWSADFYLNDTVASIRYPKYWGELSSITDQNGFENISAFTKRETTSGNVPYLVYQLTNEAHNDMTYTFKL